MLTSQTESKVISLDSASTLLPRAPRTPEETGLPFLFLVELVSKVLFLRGQVGLVELSAHLKLTVGVLDPLIVFMRAEKLCEVTRRGGSGTDADLTYNLTDLGRTRATEFMSRNAYAGPAPVTLAAYCAQVEAQSVAQMHIMREDMANEFADIVVSPIVLEQLGTAMNSGRAIFVHGPAGSGKTYLAERLAGLLHGDILVPHAIVVDGEVVQVHDPVVHPPVDGMAEQADVFDKRMLLDARWLRTRRPAVLTGGELTLDMLDLQFDPGTRFYQAPPHLKANGGIFIIDDLGRQRCSPAELMNRWIVPMDRRVDFLSLHTGYKFLVPFDVIVVFSSNFPPEQLADGSFLRRLGYKIHVGPLTEAQYERIFRQVCKQFEVPYSDDAFHYLVHQHHYQEERALLACYPRDILAQVRDLALYEGRAPSLDQRVLDWAWNNYFIGA
ncbi:ATP-binding protein [Noviherbaspirillum sedimenti]|uniref:ATP-binding protein n=1 Tax=Noviherbaspirillum sedimenti TaxID=2320865 RepID=A0A3A3G7S8_9BURK|nr:ATP-binding protein [Noviherbaspirillum sedimenti]